MYIIRKSFQRSVNLIGNLLVPSKQWMRFPRVSQVLHYNNHTFLITEAQARVGEYELWVEPYFGKYPNFVLAYRNHLEAYTGKWPKLTFLCKLIRGK